MWEASGGTCKSMRESGNFAGKPSAILKALGSKTTSYLIRPASRLLSWSEAMIARLPKVTHSELATTPYYKILTYNSSFLQ